MEFPRMTPGEAGIAPRAIMDFVNALESEHLGPHSFMLMRHGAVVAEAWWAPYAPEKVHMLYSLSKSFTSTAVGFAVQEGKIHLDDTVLSYFNDEFDVDPCPNMKKMTVRHLLTMGTGHTGEPHVFDEPNWAEGFLTSYVQREPGSVFLYNDTATYMLSCIVQKVTGQKVIDYLTPRLFEPLGIRDIYWRESPQGVNVGCSGLSVHTEDLLRFGAFLLNRGKVDGRQLLDPAWIDMAGSAQISNGNPDHASDWTQGYGFQFWLCQPKNVFRGDGAFGQYCIVMPDQDAVLVMTNGTREIARVLGCIWQYIVPAMGEPCANEGLDALRSRLASLHIDLPAGQAHREGEAALSGRYEFDHPEYRAISFDFRADTPVIRLETENETRALPLAYGRWPQSEKSLTSQTAAYAWQADGTLLIRAVLDTTPYIRDFIVRFDGQAIDVHVSNNVSMGQKEFRMIGIRM